MTFIALVFIAFAFVGVLSLVAFGICELLNRAFFDD